MNPTKAEYLPIGSLRPFQGHPFQVKDDDEMEQLVWGIFGFALCQIIEIKEKCDEDDCGSKEYGSNKRRNKQKYNAKSDGNNNGQHCKQGKRCSPLQFSDVQTKLLDHGLTAFLPS